jgi:hypothetical protein
VKDERIYLGHIRDAVSDIRAYASVGEEAFLADRMRQDGHIPPSPSLTYLKGPLRVAENTPFVKQAADETLEHA